MIMERLESEIPENVMKILRARYLLKLPNGNQESPGQMFRRVAIAVASADNDFGDFDPKESEATFLEMMQKFEFLPNSPTLMNAGAPLGQLSACFVLPVADDTQSILDAVKTQAIVQKTGGGTGFSFSRLRPEGDQVGSTGSVASGPVSFMQLFDKCTQVIKQGGKRRGANMGILSVDHPDIIDFIEMKKDNMNLPEQAKVMKEFNISVAITDLFMEQVRNDEEHILINPRTGEEVLKCEECGKNIFDNIIQKCGLCGGKGVRIRAREIWSRIINNAWACADPGLIFIDKINNSMSNPMRDHFKIESTNPCGEVPLLPNESCNLGSLNLSNYLNGDKIDWPRLRTRVRDSIHFLDNVVTVNKYPTPEIRELSHGMRRLGLGVMGFADMLSKLCIRYGSQESFDLARKVSRFISEEAWKMSEELASTRGVFPLWGKSDFATKGKRVRNVNSTIIAPTGSIGTIASCSPGIEPHYALIYTRRSRIKERSEDFEVLHYLNDDFVKALREEHVELNEHEKDEISRNGGSIQNISWIPKKLKDRFVIAADITPEQHVLMQSAFQEFVDNGVSKTINLANEASIDDVEKAYSLAYETHCKGITVYRDGSLDVQVLETKKTTTARESISGTQTESIGTTLPGGYFRPEFLEGRTYRFTYNNSGLFITVNKDERGAVREVFIERGKSGDEEKAAYEGLGRTISIALQSAVDIKELIKTLRGIQTRNVSWHKTKDGSIPIRSVPDALAHALAQSIHSETQYSPREHYRGEVGEKCPSCQEYSFVHIEGCNKCLICEFSECS